MISSSETELLLQALQQSYRSDGRPLLETRQIKITPYADFTKVEVQLGKTRVYCSIHLEITPPRPNKPSDGILTFSVDLGPIASPLFTLGNENRQASELATDIALHIEKVLRTSRAISPQSLCITPHSRVWSLRADVRVLNDDGNLRDAAMLAVLCALYQAPKIDTSSFVSSAGGNRGEEGRGEERGEEREEREDRGRLDLPMILSHFPFMFSFAYFPKGEILILDPLYQEENLSSCIISVALNDHGELCGVHKPGGSPVSFEVIQQCIQIAKSRVPSMTELVKQTAL